jgi:hypothetical protein
MNLFHGKFIYDEKGQLVYHAEFEARKSEKFYRFLGETPIHLTKY